MESIDHILSKMREPSCFKGKIPVERVDADFRYFADRIETVVKALVADRDNWRRQALAEDARANAATCEKSSQVGNAAKMREALEDSNGLLDELSRIGEWYESANGQIKENNYALATLPRNCDLYATEGEAYQAYLKVMENTPKEEQVYFESWLFAEAKGERQ